MCRERACPIATKQAFRPHERLRRAILIEASLYHTGKLLLHMLASASFPFTTDAKMLSENCVVESISTSVTRSITIGRISRGLGRFMPRK